MAGRVVDLLTGTGNADLLAELFDTKGPWHPVDVKTDVGVLAFFGQAKLDVDLVAGLDQMRDVDRPAVVAKGLLCTVDREFEFAESSEAVGSVSRGAIR